MILCRGFSALGVLVLLFMSDIRLCGFRALAREGLLLGECILLPQATPILSAVVCYTYSLHCSSFLGLPCRILIIDLVKPKIGTTMETRGRSKIP